MGKASHSQRLSQMLQAACFGQENRQRGSIKKHCRLLIERLEDRTLLDGGLLQSISPANPVVSLSDGAGGLAPKASLNGRFIVYQSSAPNLVSGQVEIAPVGNIFLYDQQTELTMLVTHRAESDTTTAEGPSTAPHLSRDGC